MRVCSLFCKSMLTAMYQRNTGELCRQTNCGKSPLETLRVSQLLQKLSSFLWNSNVRVCIYGRPPLFPVPSQINSGHSVLVYFFKIHSNTIFPSTSRSSEWSVFLRIPYQNPVFYHRDNSVSIDMLSQVY